MTAQEAKFQADRIFKYDKLKKLRDEAYEVRARLTEEWKENGPCGQGPFTGNTRESRKVNQLHIMFSRTRGGAREVEIKINNISIEASRLGRFLVSEVEARIASITAEIEKL